MFVLSPIGNILMRWDGSMKILLDLITKQMQDRINRPSSSIERPVCFKTRRSGQEY